MVLRADRDGYRIFCTLDGTAPSPEHEMTQAGVDHDEDGTGATPTDATSSTGGFLYNRMNSNERRDLERMHRLLHLGRTAP